MAARATIDHDTIRTWVEERGGCPARVRGTGRTEDDPGLIRIDYTGFSGQDTLERIPWEAWFEALDRSHLAFLFDERPNSRFSKLVDRSSVHVDEGAPAGGPGRDVVDLILQQHDEVRKLFDGIEDDREQLNRLLDQLSLHLAAEEAAIYPVLLGTPLADQIYDAVTEHHNVMRLIADLVEGELDDGAVAARIRVLRRLVEEHMEEEEREVLPRMQRLFDDEQRRRMARSMNDFASELTRDGDSAAIEAVLSNAEVPATV